MAPTLRNRREQPAHQGAVTPSSEPTDDKSTPISPSSTPTPVTKEVSGEPSQNRLVSLRLTGTEGPQRKLRLQELVVEQLASPWWCNFAEIPEAERRSFLQAALSYVSIHDELFKNHAAAKEKYNNALQRDSESFAKFRQPIGLPALTQAEHDKAHIAVSLAQAEVKQTRDAIAKALEAYTKVKNCVERTLILEATKACIRDNVAATIESRKMWIEHGKMLGIPWNQTPSYLKFSMPEPDDSLIHPEPCRRKSAAQSGIKNRKRRFVEED
ncbi:hypothetical protein K490DRAFT_55264 [Saccharata proteae CBS 121410]|uniref:Uncharacterized protein n=1 Tax=Saccharata proteae CBS 121410 TaxID=1314787 RepID=A0A6A5YFU1_9PEZI|nr:hypothetical protein K490DRAFT_55264 [Saccharata proteae CBS 121410]